MSDRLIRAIDEPGRFRFHIACTTDMVEHSRQIHEASTTATAAMGRLLTMVTIMSMGLESEGESITLNVRGDGPGGMMVAVSDAPGTGRVSAASPKADVPSREDGHLDVGGWVGRDGQLSIVRSLHLKEPFVGITPIVTGEIGDDFAAYFFHSEQTPTVVALGVLIEPDHHVSAAGGIFIQALPDATDEDLDRLEAAIGRMDSVTSMFARGLSPEGILKVYFGEFNPTVLDAVDCRYECLCTREKTGRVLATLPQAEREMLAQADGGAEVICEFCATPYRFTAEELIRPALIFGVDGEAEA